MALLFLKELKGEQKIYKRFVIIIKIVQLVGRFKATDAGRLRAEYNRLVEGLALRGDLSGKYVFRKVICGLIESTQSTRHIF